LLELPRGLKLSVIDDGAKWICDQAARRFKNQHAQWVVDVYLMMLYLFAPAAAMESSAAGKWVGERVIELIEMGGPRFIEHLGSTGPPDSTAPTMEVWKNC
jgi:hypothetical protein